MAFAAPLMMIATAVGAAATAYGQYQQGQATAARMGAEADVNRKLAGVALTNAQYDIASGEVKAQQAGLVGRAASGRQLVRPAAGNIAGRSVADVQASQAAITAENEAIQRADAAHAAYGEQIQGAERTTAAGADIVAGRTAIAAGDVSALGSIAGGGTAVAKQWYDVASTTKDPSSIFYTG
jgi:hypothetical protein